MVFFIFWSIKSIFHLSKYSLKQYYWYNFPQKRINAKTSLINRNYKTKTYIQKLLTNNIYRSTYHNQQYSITLLDTTQLVIYSKEVPKVFFQLTFVIKTLTKWYDPINCHWFNIMRGLKWINLKNNIMSQLTLFTD